MSELQKSVAQSLSKDGAPFFQALFESAPDATIVANERGLIVFANKQTKTILGYESYELLECSVEILVPERYKKDHPTLRDSFFKDTSIRPMGKGQRLSVLRKDGTELDAEIYLIPVQMKDQTFVCCSIRDITERCKLEATLQQAQKIEAIGRLTGSIAHDFNNLLTVIIGRADIALSKDDLSEPIRRNIKLIQQTGERAATLTRQLLQFSRQQVVKPKVIDLNRVLGEMQEMLRRLVNEDIKLELKYFPRLRRIKVDTVQIQQVIMNLVVNARDAMPNGGVLKIETANVVLKTPYTQNNGQPYTGTCVSLVISDTGCGIDDKVSERIFEPFFTTKEIGKGTGLGLATAFGIIKQADGHICFESEKGLGTTFRVFFPIVDEASLSAPSLTSVDLVGGDETILLVEDEADVRQLLKDVLSGLGYKILIAQDGEEAVRISNDFAGTIHIMLVDVVMPKLNGLQAAREIFRQRPKTKVIFISGYTGDAELLQDIVSSGVSFIEKPFKSDFVAMKVRELLDSLDDNLDEIDS